MSNPTDASGASLGNARAFITVDTSGFVSGARVISDASRQMSDEGRKFGQAWDGVASSFKARLSSMGAGLRSLAGDFAALSISAGVISKIAVDNATAVQQLEIRFRALLGSQEAAEKQMQRLAEIAGELNAPVQDVQRSFAQLLPLVDGNVEEAEKYLKLAARLATLNPTEGIAGATFAIGEAISSAGSDFVSLAERFQISKRQLRELTAETGSFAGGLDAVLDKFGATTAALEESGNTFTVALRNATGELGAALGEGITPALNNTIIPALKQVTQFLRELRQNNPAVLEFAANFALVATAIAPVTFALSQVITALQTLKSIGVVKIGVTYAALDIGNRIGLGAAQFLADRGVGNQRLRSDSGEDPGAVIGETLKQVIVIIVNAFLDIGQAIYSSGVVLGNVFGQIGNALELFKLRLIDAGLSLIEAVGQLAVDLGNQFNIQALRDIGQPIVDGARQQREGGGQETIYTPQGPIMVIEASPGTIDQIRALEERIANGIELTADQQAEIEGKRETLNNAILAPLMQFLNIGPAVQEFQKGLQDASRSVETGGNELGRFLIRNREELAELAEKIAEAREQFALQSERIAEDRSLASSREAQDFAISRGREINDFMQGRAREDAQFYADRQRNIERFNSEMTESDTQANQGRMRRLAEFNLQMQRAAEDHGLRLAEIQRQTDRRTSQATARLDANALYEAIQSGRDQMDAEQQQYELSQRRRQEDFDIQMEQLLENQTEQRAARIRAFQQQLADDLQQHNTRRTQQMSDFQARLRLEDEDRRLRQQRQIEDYRIQDRRRLEDFQKRLSDYDRESRLLSGFANAAISQAKSITNNLVAEWFGFLNAVNGSLRSGSGGSGPGQQMPTFSTAASPMPVGKGMSSGFASGGNTYYVDIAVNEASTPQTTAEMVWQMLMNKLEVAGAPA